MKYKDNEDCTDFQDWEKSENINLIITGAILALGTIAFVGYLGYKCYKNVNK